VKIGASLFTIAVGAILAFAVDWSPSGIDLETVGVILMIVGGILFLISLIILATRANRGEPIEPGGIVEERRIYNDDPLP
jgi:hypothetical protein